jgi:ribosomal protein RSM22 (predicted rRNA methylase)
MVASVRSFCSGTPAIRPKAGSHRQAADKGALNYGSLWQAFDTIKTSQLVVEQKEAISKQAPAKARAEMMEQLLAQRRGMSVDALLAQQFPGYYLPQYHGLQPLNIWTVMS